MASKDVSEKLHHFLANVSIALGQTKGRTCLPLPPIEHVSSGSSSVLGSSGGSGGNVSTYKDRVHLLESAVITWTKQIKAVLKQDPETKLKSGDQPTPEVEVRFWEAKAANLNSVFEQLQSERVRKVLRFLDLLQVHLLHSLCKIVQGSLYRKGGGER